VTTDNQISIQTIISRVGWIPGPCYHPRDRCVGAGSSWAAARAPPPEPPHMSWFPHLDRRARASIHASRLSTIVSHVRLGLLQVPPTRPGRKSQTSPRRVAFSLQTNATPRLHRQLRRLQLSSLLRRRCLCEISKYL
jgi:hypothetical protein